MVNFDDILNRIKQTPLHLHTNQKERELRTSICNLCEFKEQFMGFDKCSLCGCFIYLKVSLNNSRCPKDKWTVIPIIDQK
jgi:hypothetical protein